MVKALARGPKPVVEPKGFSWSGLFVGLLLLPFQVAFIHFFTICSIFGVSGPIFLMRDFLTWYRTVFIRRTPLMFLFEYYDPRHFLRSSHVANSVPMVAKPFALLNSFPLFRRVQPTAPRKLLVLDVDESLLIATRRPLPYCTFALPLPPRHNDDDLVHHYFVCERPHVQFFLSVVASWYNVVVFTAGTRAYVTPIIERLDPERRRISRLFCREDLVRQVKPLSVPIEAMLPQMPHLSLAHVVHIDDRPTAMESADNSVVLPPFTESLAARGDDEALLHALPLLDALRFVEDVRHVLSLRPHRTRMVAPQPSTPGSTSASGSDGGTPIRQR